MQWNYPSEKLPQVVVKFPTRFLCHCLTVFGQAVLFEYEFAIT